MSLPHTFQIIAGIMGNHATGGGGGGGDPVSLPEYGATSNTVTLSTSANPGGSSPAWAAVAIILNSDGTGVYRTSTYTGGDTDVLTFTWLNTGSASDYYAYMDTPDGDTFSVLSDSTATSLQMTQQRYWQLYAETPDANVTKLATSILRLKNSSGTDLDAINVSMLVSATFTGF